MSELPKGWIYIAIADIGEVVTGSTPPTKEKDRFYNGNIPFVKPPDLEAGNYLFSAKETLSYEGALRARLLPPNSILVNCIGNIGKVAFSHVACCTNQQVNSIIPNLLLVEPKFVYWSILSPIFQSLLQSNSSATTVSIINKGRFSALEIPLSPLKEQHRIVAKLDRLFARSRRAREELDRIPKLCDRYKQAVLAAAFRGDLTADWREQNLITEPASRFLKNLLEKRRYLLEQSVSQKSEGQTPTPSNEKRRRYKEPVDFREERLFDLPKTWMFVSADQISLQITDGEHVQPPYQSEGVPMLSAKHVRDGYVDISDIKFISKDDFEKAASRCAPENGDVLIVSVGATTGRAAIVFDCPPFAIVRSVLLMKPLISSKFIYYWISSPFCQDWISKASGASAQPHFYINDNKRMPIPLPPETEAQEIVQRIEKLFKVIDLMGQEYQKASKLCNRLEQATLAKAFRGELVPQDPNDEPAAALLERLQAETPNRIKGKSVKSKQRSGEKL